MLANTPSKVLLTAPLASLDTILTLDRPLAKLAMRATSPALVPAPARPVPLARLPLASDPPRAQAARLVSTLICKPSLRAKTARPANSPRWKVPISAMTADLASQRMEESPLLCAALASTALTPRADRPTVPSAPLVKVPSRATAPASTVRLERLPPPMTTCATRARREHIPLSPPPSALTAKLVTSRLILGPPSVTRSANLVPILLQDRISATLVKQVRLL